VTSKKNLSEFIRVHPCPIKRICFAFFINTAPSSPRAYLSHTEPLSHGEIFINFVPLCLCVMYIEVQENREKKRGARG